MNPQALHVQIVFEVIKALFDGILLSIRAQCFRSILGLVAYDYKLSNMILFMPADRLFIILNFSLSFRKVPDKEIFVIKYLVFSFLIMACQFIMALEQSVGKFLFSSSAFRLS